MKQVPGRTVVSGAVMLGAASLGVVVSPAIGWAVAAADLLLIVGFALEGRALRREPVTVEREFPARLPIGRAAKFVYRVENRGRAARVVRLRQPWPATFEPAVGEVEVSVGPGEVVRVGLEATPRCRGREEIPPAEVERRGAMRLAAARGMLSGTASVTCYPDLTKITEYETLRRHRALALAGVHRVRRVGSGREFERLRDYIPDDEYRDINWKATARRGRPITNTFINERSQELMICVETGRMMGNPVGSGTVLDAAVDAAMLLAHACIDQGDRVGLAIFREKVTRFVRPMSGPVATRRVMEELIEAAPEPVFPSYAAMVQALRAGHRKRSMIFIFTDLNDPQLAADLAEVAPLLSQRHVVVVVSLRDPMLDRVARGPAGNRGEVLSALAAGKLAAERAACVGQLAKAGVRVLEAGADELTMKVVNRYLEIKMRQLA